MPSARTRMKSIFREALDSPSSYVTDESIDLPPLSKYSVLVEVKACALSEVCDKVMQLLYRDKKCMKYPVGQDIAGIVKEVGPSVTTLQPGDEVVGVIPLDYGISGCAEYVVLHEFDLTRKPEKVSFIDAAGCIGDAVKAYTALHYLGRLSGGDTVLVMDGASSFGSLAVQLAHHWGAKVITTVSSEDEKLYLERMVQEVTCIADLTKQSKNLNGNGNEGIVYSTCMEESGGLGVDLIIDSGVSMFSEEKDRIIANDNYTYPVPSKHEVLSALAVGGRWVTSKQNLQLDPPNSRILFMKCASVGFLFEHAWTLSSTQQGRYLHILMDIMEKVADGVISPNIHHTVSFESVPDALRRLGEVRVGKVVMKMD